MKNGLSLISIIVILLPVVACNWLGQKRMPGIDIPLDEMNNELQLSAPPEISTFTIGDSLGLVLVNSSDTQVILPQNYGVSIFQYTNKKWESIENRIEYPIGETIVLPKDDQPFREVVVVVHPSIISDQPVTVRIVVVGNYYIETSREKGEQIGAFIDVTLEPK